MQHFTIQFLPDHRTVRIHAGATLFEAAGQADIVLVSPCGGKGHCRKCKVHIEPSGEEVLACQFKITQDLTVTVPRASRYYRQQILVHGREKKITADPCWKKIHFPDPPATKEQLQKILSDAAGEPVAIPPRFSFPAEGEATAVLRFDGRRREQGWELVCLEKTNHRHLYGAAVDIGTTTVVLHLADLQTGKILATVSTANPQHQRGDDVISRIHFASKPQGQDWMQREIIVCLNGLLRQAAGEANVHTEQIYELVAVGNTTMNHLLMKFPVAQLGQSPYAPHTTDAFDAPAQNFGLALNPHGNLHTVQNIAGFVGSDTVADAIAADLATEPQTTLLVDIGTNTEIVLCHHGKLYTASCAAGPALEGARVLHGSRAMDGAIQRVVLDSSTGDIDLDVIGDGTPHSICGSGLIDALAVLVEAGVISPAGGFVPKEELAGKLSHAMLARLTEYEKQPAFVLAKETGNSAVILTQRDVRQLQLAKAAIRAGIKVLKKTAEIDNTRIEKLLLAGAFGNYIQKTSALRIGLLPHVAAEHIHFIGNAAGGGALEILLNRTIRANCRTLARRMEYIELASRPDFQDIFADSLMF
ncbi:MAG: DUF4445 domain-containing protein [Planctomycetes bacterium]|nr:DUF4445 domain-containing protein [Planctomycetota bacterium]